MSLLVVALAVLEGRGPYDARPRVEGVEVCDHSCQLALSDRRTCCVTRTSLEAELQDPVPPLVVHRGQERLLEGLATF